MISSQTGNIRFVSGGCLLQPGLICLVALGAGCNLNDPNRVAQIRHLMANEHARAVLQAAGSSLSPESPDYSVLVFWRNHLDSANNTQHRYELYDFVKTSQAPGPESFVIAYDNVTRSTYLRSDLRSNQNLDRLP